MTDVVGINFEKRVLIYDDGYEIPIVSWHGARGMDETPENAASFVAFDRRSQTFHVGHTEMAVYATVH